MTYLITGGAGFIGSNFLHYLKDHTDTDPEDVVELAYEACEEAAYMDDYLNDVVRIDG